MFILKKISSLNNARKWQNIEKNTEIEIEKTALKDNSQLKSPEYIMEYIRGETTRLESHIDRLATKNNNRSDNYTTPQSLITLIKIQFKNLDTILKQLVMLLKYQINENSFLTNANQQRYNTILQKIIEYRQAITSALNKLIDKSAELNYPLNNSLYTPVLTLKGVVGPLLDLVKADQSLTELFAEPTSNEAGMSEVMTNYLKQIEYLPYKVYMALLSMELSEQQAKKQQNKAQQNEFKHANYIPLDKPK